MALNDREWALIAWVAIAIAFMMANAGTREALGGLIKAFLQRLILIMLALVALYSGFWVWLLARLSLWEWSNLKTTLIWLLSFGFVTALSTSRIKDEQLFYRKTVRDTLSATTAVVFVAEFQAFPFLVEFVLAAAIFLFSGVAVVARQKPETMRVAHLAEWILPIIALAYVINGTAGVVRRFEEFAAFDTARDFAIPIVLSLAFLPFVYVLLRYMSIERITASTRFAMADPGLRHYAIVQAIVHFATSEDFLNRWRRELQLRRPASRIEVDAITARLKTSKAREDAPPSPVDPALGWSPYAAISFLHQRGLRPADWHEVMGSWHADTHLIELGPSTGFNMANNIAYYIEGDEHVARSLCVRLNINDHQTSADAERTFRETALTLARAAIPGHDSEVEAFLADNDIAESAVAGQCVRLTRDVFVVGNPPGYTRSFFIEATHVTRCDT